MFKRLPRTNLHRKQFIPNSHDFPGLDNTTVWFNYFPGVQWYVLTLRTCWKLEWTSKIAIKVRCVFTCLTVLLNIPHNCYKRTDGEDSNICYCHGRQSKDCQVNDLHLVIFNTLHITWSKKISQPNTQVSKKINPTILQSSCISVIIKWLQGHETREKSKIDVIHRKMYNL